jgi:fucose 4-O-acetylase-like acetyltransferase
LKNVLFNANFVLNQERNAWVDYVKGICIIFVCYRHSFEGLNTDGSLDLTYPVLKFINVYFYGFRMPLFFLLSGVFVNILVHKNGTKEYIQNRFKTTYYPFLVWGFIQISLQLLFKEWVNADRTVSDYVNLIFFPRKIEQFWYLNALFYIGVFYVLIQKWTKITTLQHIGVGLLLYVLSAWLNAVPTSAFFFTDICQFYIFFAVGAQISKWILSKEHEKWLESTPVGVLSTLIFAAVQYVLYRINTQHGVDYYAQNNLPIIFLGASLIGCAYVMMVGKWLANHKWLKWLRIIGYHSLYIYLLHVMLLAAVRNLFLHVLDIQNIPLLILVALIIAIVVPIALFNILSRAGMWWLFTAKKPAFLTSGPASVKQ